MVTNYVDEGHIACVAKVIFSRTHADRFATLSVQITPVATERRFFDYAQRIGARQLRSVRHQPQVEIAFGIGNQILDDARSIAVPNLDRRRQSAQWVRRQHNQISVNICGRIAPHVLGDHGQTKRLTDNCE